MAVRLRSQHGSRHIDYNPVSAATADVRDRTAESQRARGAEPYTGSGNFSTRNWRNLRSTKHAYFRKSQPTNGYTSAAVANGRSSQKASSQTRPFNFASFCRASRRGQPMAAVPTFNQLFVPATFTTTSNSTLGPRLTSSTRIRSSFPCSVFPSSSVAV